MTKTTIALATALLLGVASAAYAGDRDEPEHKGGFRVGPLGQDFATGVNPVDHPSLRGASGYAYQARGKRNQSR
jgi:hypothetical protein